MAKKPAVAADVSPRQTSASKSAALSRAQPRASALVDTRVIYCGDNLEQLRELPAEGLREIDPFFKADHAIIIPLTVKEILDEQIARKLV